MDDRILLAVNLNLPKTYADMLRGKQVELFIDDDSVI
jgi:hypothetical protein